MGLFSFLFSKNKKLRTTYEAETFRTVFREDEELFLRVQKSEELRNFQVLNERVNSPQFKQHRKEIEQLSYKNSEYYKAEKQYKALLKMKKLRSYMLIHASQELKGYEHFVQTPEYQEYLKLKVIVQSVGFDKKLHASEYVAYKEMITRPKIRAAIKFEKLRRYKEYSEVKKTDLPSEFEKLAVFVQSDDFKANRKFLLDKNRYKTTEDYRMLEEYERLKKSADIVKYCALLNDSYFNSMRKWQLVFEDDFEQGRLDATKWITRYYPGERFLNDTYGVGNDVQLFTPDNVSLQGSAAVLSFRKESIIGKYWDQKLGIREKEYEYTSGMISTAAVFRQRYGRFEAKIKLNHSPVTSCFWMLGNTDMPHIEIMKCQADGVYMGRVYRHKTVPKSDIQQLKEVTLGDEYYIFTFEWTEEKMVWMVNDMVVKEVRENIPDEPMYIVLSLGAQEVPADKLLPIRMEIDWVRGYRLKR